MRNEILGILRNVLKTNNFDIELNEENIKKNFKLLGIDSITAFSMIVNVEQKLNCELSDEELTNLNTINDLITRFENKLKK